MRTVSVILFDGFELLDVCGPVEILSHGTSVTVQMVGPGADEPVASAQGTRLLADRSYASLTSPDILLVPGGMGTRSLVDDAGFLAWLGRVGGQARLVTSVCTGSAVLAAAGLLRGYGATSNKLAFSWASSFGREVGWRPVARWVHDRDRWTSSGVAAGMDMAAALLEDLRGPEEASSVLRRVEYEPHREADIDPFAVAGAPGLSPAPPVRSSE